MKTKTISVYEFGELSDKAKLNAMAEYNSEYFWSSDNEKTLREFEKHFPVKIKNYEYGYGKYISFDFTESEEIENLSGFRLATYLWNNYSSVLYKGKYYSLWSKKDFPFNKHHNKPFPALKSRYSKVLKDNSCVLTGYCIDDDTLEPIYNFLKKPSHNVNFNDLMSDCLNSWLSACEKDFEWNQSEECFLETCEANNYEFDERGNLI